MHFRGRTPAWGIAAVLAAAAPLAAQQGTVTGTIMDESTNRPIGGAWVQVTGTGISSVSTPQGAYILRLSPGTHQLRVVILGYASASQSVTLEAGSTRTVDFALRPAAFSLEEIVVTATGERLSRELGNTVGRIDAASVAETAPVTNLTQVLNGRVAGVNVLQSTGTTGQGARIRIRGISSVSLSNDPVVYIDGVRVASESPVGAFIGGGRVSHLNNLNPAEIESIEIVKGPSAATLYGTQAANGVVRITTKRGVAGAPRWAAWLEGGILSDPNEYPSTYYSKAVGSDALCLPYQEALGTCQIERLYVLSLLNDKETTPFATGNRMQGGASVSGGSEAIRYFVAADYERELGLLKMADREVDHLRNERGTDDIPFEQRRPNELRRFGGRMNLSATPHRNVDVSVATGLVASDIRLPQTGDNFQSIIGSPLFGQALPRIVEQTGGYGFSRPADALGEVTWRRNRQYTTSGTASWRPAGWLTTRATVGLDYLDYADEQNVLNGQGCVTCATERLGKRMINEWEQAKYSVDANATATWQVSGRIGSRTSVGAQYNYDRLFGVQTQADELPPGALTLSAGARKTLTESTNAVKTIGEYVEQQFSLDDVLFLTGALRVDANSAFGRESRSAVYPKVSSSWVAMEGRPGLLNDVRLRAAYGQSGQQPTPTAALTFDLPVTASVFGAPNVSGVVLGALGDPALKPERSSEIEGGFDLGLLSNRVRLGVTGYSKTTEDALVNRNIPLSLGAVQTRIENIGEISNRGLEISLNARIVDREAIAWDLQVEASGNRNRLESLGEGVPPLVGFGFKNIPGYPMFGLWWQSLKSYDDANRDGYIDPSEVVVSDTLEFQGSTVPTRTLAVMNSVSLFNSRVRLGLMGEYKGGYVTHNVNGLFQCAFQRNCRALHHPDASLEDQAKAIAGPRAFGAYAEDGSFVRLREASLSYQFSPDLAARIGARTAALTLTGRNLWMWKAFDSWDPENVTQSVDGPNYNFVQQAQPMIFILRANVGW